MRNSRIIPKNISRKILILASVHIELIDFPSASQVPSILGIVVICRKCSRALHHIIWTTLSFTLAASYFFHNKYNKTQLQSQAKTLLVLGCIAHLPFFVLNEAKMAGVAVC